MSSLGTFAAITALPEPCWSFAARLLNSIQLHKALAFDRHTACSVSYHWWFSRRRTVVGFPSLRITKSGSFSTILNFLGTSYGETTALANCLYSLQVLAIVYILGSAMVSGYQKGATGHPAGAALFKIPKFHDFSPGNACFYLFFNLLKCLCNCTAFWPYNYVKFECF